MDETEQHTFHEVDLRNDSAKVAQPSTSRPHSTSRIHSIFNTAIRKTFTRKKRRLTTPVAESDIVKNSISEPVNCSQKAFTVEDIGFSRNSIQCCPFDISGYGSFLRMDLFKVNRPKKMTTMVFLFEKIIIFTTKQPDEESYYYIGSLKMEQLGVVPSNKNKRILELKDFVTSKRFHKETIYTLEAVSEYIQFQWRGAIEKCLWGQLLQAKIENESGKT